MALQQLNLFISVLLMHNFVSEGGQYLNIETVHRPVKGSIVITDERTKSLLQCAFQCKRRFGLSLYYKDQEQTCTCNKELDTNAAHDPALAQKIYGIFTELPVTVVSTTQHPENLVTTIPRQDCNKHKEAGHSEEGGYPLLIKDTGKIVYVLCIMPGGVYTGPLTVFQFRSKYSGPLEFYRPWSEYVSGFGNAAHDTEYWLGLDHIAAMTNAKPYGLNIQLTISETDALVFPSFQFREFSLIANESYRMILSTQINVGSTCEPELNEYDLGSGMRFSTYDADHDLDDSTNCSEFLKSAWWFGRSCETFQLNGPMLKGPDVMPFLNFPRCWGTNKIIQTEMSLFTES